MPHEHESDEGSSTTGSNSLNGDLPIRKFDRRSPSPSAMLERHSNVELATIKAEVRRLRNELEAKDEELHFQESDLEEKERQILKFQEERLELIRDARAARDLRDELEFAAQKLQKTERLEQENAVLREKISQMDYFKGRADQLRKECDSLEESNRLLELQLDDFRHKGRATSDVEQRLYDSQRSVKELHAEIAAKNTKIEEILLQQAKLEHELSEALSRAQDLMAFSANSEGSPRNDSLAAQLEECDRGEAAQLRLQNQKLQQKLEAIEREKENSFVSQLPELETSLEESRKLLSDEKEENSRLHKQLVELEQSLTLVSSEREELTVTCSTLRIERDSAHKSLQEARKSFAVFQQEAERRSGEVEAAAVKRMELEISSLQQQLAETRLELSAKEQLLSKSREEQKSARSELDKLEDERKILEREKEQAERQKRFCETEKNALKEKLERLENEVETSRVLILSSDDARRRLETTEKALVEAQNKVGDLEHEKRTMAQQVEIEAKKVQSLREDLVAEKSRLSDLISRLRSVCTGIALNGGKIEADMDDVKLVKSIDDVIMTALSAARREADALRLQQHTQIAELTDLKKDIEKLRRTENESLNESDDRVRNLSKELTSGKEQIFKLQERVRELQLEIASKGAEIAASKREAEELRTNSANVNKIHNELATLQVSLRNAQLQADLHKKDNEELRKQIDIAEKAKREAKRDADQIASLHQTLLSDHDRLQQLHDMLSHDYERAKFEIAELKKMSGDLRTSRTAHDRLLRHSAESQNELGALRRELQALRKENECLTRNCDDLGADIYKLRLADQSQKGTIKNLQATIESLTRQLEAKELDCSKLKNRLDMFHQLNRTLDEENKQLKRQLELLLHQNRELLNRALSEKDHFHQEQRDFQEKLSKLHRHKEKLEEKIMDQYKAMESKKAKEVKDKEKPTLVKRAAKALIPKKSRSDKTSTGSTSTEDSAAFSADEQPAPAPQRLEDEFGPTCSSSEDVDRLSPLLERVFRAEIPAPPLPPFRARHDLFGGSVRVLPVSRASPERFALRRTFARQPLAAPPPSNARRLEALTERGVDVPPKMPVRNAPNTQSLRCRPPPPPYQPPKHKPPPPYQCPRTQTHTPPSSSDLCEFRPQMTSTPKSDHPIIVKEGELRPVIRDKEERDQKAASLYENVSRDDFKDDSLTTNVPSQSNGSTVWYEYGCV